MMSTQPDVFAFDQEIRRLTGDAKGFPFLCNGSPFNCDIFLVGINPATETPFWDCWSLENGCNKVEWLKLREKMYGRPGPTRRRIQCIFSGASPARVLETNIFHRASKRESHLSKADRRPVVFDFLLKALQPRVIFVYGRSAIKHLEERTKTSLKHGEFIRTRCGDVESHVIAGYHLSYYQWSDSKATELGRRLCERRASLK